MSFAPGHSINLGYDKKVHEIHVDMTSMFEIQQEVSRNGVLFAALRLIKSQMFSGGINFEFEEGGVRREANEWFKDIVNRYWMPFVRDALEHVYMFGFFVVTLAKPDSSVRDYVPVVPPLGSYEVAMYYKNGLRKYRVYEAQSWGVGAGAERKLIPRALVFEVWPPNHEGRLMSPVASVIGHIKRLREMWQNLEEADYWRARPPSMRERRKDVRSDPSDPMPSSEFCAEDDLALDEERHVMRMTKNQVDMARYSQYLASQQNRGATREVYDPRSGTYKVEERVPPWESHTVILPPGQQSSSFQIPESHQDYVRIVALQQSTIALALGIPPQLLFNDVKQHAADVQLTSRIFNSTIMDLQRQFEIFLTRIHHEIYQGMTDNHVDEKVQNERVRRSRNLNEREIQEIYTEMRTHVSFRFTPMLQLDDLLRIVDQQWLDHDTAGRYALTMFSLPETDLLPQSEIRTGDAATAARNPRGKDAKPTERALLKTTPAEPEKKRQKTADGDGGDDDDAAKRKKKTPASTDDSAAKEPRRVAVRAHERILK